LVLPVRGEVYYAQIEIVKEIATWVQTIH